MERAIERGAAAQSAPAPRKLTAQTIKAAIADYKSKREAK